MQLHASCAAREQAGVLLLGPSRSGKSDLLLRLLDLRFMLVADDRVDIEDGYACPPPALAGLLEIRGLGIVRLPYLVRARLALAVELATPTDRLPERCHHPDLGLPRVSIDPWTPSAPQRVALALDCALGSTSQVAGAFRE
jgi:HPr kinase/phosphorylase